MVRIPSRPPKMVFCESRMLCPAFGVVSSQVVSSLLKLRESELRPRPLFIPVRRIIGDWCRSLHRGDANISVTSTSSVFRPFGLNDSTPHIQQCLTAHHQEIPQQQISHEESASLVRHRDFLDDDGDAHCRCLLTTTMNPASVLPEGHPTPSPPRRVKMTVLAVLTDGLPSARLSCEHDNFWRPSPDA